MPTLSNTTSRWVDGSTGRLLCSAIRVGPILRTKTLVSRTPGALCTCAKRHCRLGTTKILRHPRFLLSILRVEGTQPAHWICGMWLRGVVWSIHRDCISSFAFWLCHTSANTKILKRAQFLCQFYELRELNTHTQLTAHWS